MQADQRPDFHFLMIAPNLGAEWLFDAAREYWEAFHPTVIDNFDFIRLIPNGYTVTLTLIAMRDSVPALGVQLAQTLPNAYLDGVIYNTFEATRDELDRRASTDQPFGVPLAVNIQGTPIPQIPTPRLNPTRPPSGFITMTPTPNAEATPAPEVTDPSGETSNENLQPIQRTPGPITGG